MLDQSEGSPLPTLSQARSALDSGAVHDAGRMLLRLMRDAPTLGIEKLLLRAVARVEPPETGEDWLRAAARMGLSPVAEAQARYRLAQRSRDPGAVIRRGEAWLALDDEPKAARDLVPMIRALSAQGLHSRIIELTDRLLADTPTSRAALECRLTALLDLHDTDPLLDALDDWLTGPDAHPAWMLLLSQVFRRAPTAADGVQELFLRLARRWPDAPETEKLGQALRCRRDGAGQWRSRRDCIAAVPKDLSDGAYLDALLAATFGSAAKAGTGETSKLRTQIARNALQRPLIRTDPYAALQGSLPHQAEEVVVVFTGLRSETAGTALDARFALQGKAALFLRDSSGQMFLHGLPGTAGGFDGMLHAIRDALRAYGPDARLTIWGASGSGVAALRAACALGADRFIGFGATTDVTLAFQQRYRDFRASHLIARLNRDLPPEALQTRPWLERCGHTVPCAFHFGSYAPHRNHALQLQGLPNVRLHQIPGHDKAKPLGEAAKRGVLDDIIAGVFTGYSDSA